jgi:hypothetical protein
MTALFERWSNRKGTLREPPGDRGIRQSLLQFLADDSVVFAPDPKNGKKFYTEYKDHKAVRIFLDQPRRV